MIFRQFLCVEESARESRPAHCTDRGLQSSNDTAVGRNQYSHVRLLFGQCSVTAISIVYRQMGFLCNRWDTFRQYVEHPWLERSSSYRTFWGESADISANRQSSMFNLLPQSIPTIAIRNPIWRYVLIWELFLTRFRVVSIGHALMSRAKHEGRVHMHCLAKLNYYCYRRFSVIC